MIKSICLLQVFVLSLLFIGCSNGENQDAVDQGSKAELFAVGTTRITKSSPSTPYLFTLDNIKSFNAQTREIVFQDFEPTNKLFPIYRNI